MRTLAVTKVTLFGTFFLFWFEEVDCNNGDGESSHTSVWGDIRPPRGNTELAKNTRENIKFQEAYARYFIIPHLSEVLKNVCKRLFCGLKPPTRARLVLFLTGAEMDDAEMKHELCNFLPRPDPGAGCGQDTLAGPAARPTFTLHNLAPPHPSPAHLHVAPVLTPCRDHCRHQCCRRLCAHAELETGLSWARTLNNTSPVLLELHSEHFTLSRCLAAKTRLRQGEVNDPSRRPPATSCKCIELRPLHTLQRFRECNLKHFL